MYAYSLGYKMHLLDCAVSEIQGSPFKAYIETLYQERLATKALMKKYVKDSSEYRELDAKQALLKLFMNSLYGKLGEKLDREI